VRGMEIRTCMGGYPAEAARDTDELAQMFAAGTVRTPSARDSPWPKPPPALRYVRAQVLASVVIDVGVISRNVDLSGNSRPKTPTISRCSVVLHLTTA